MYIKSETEPADAIFTKILNEFVLKNEKYLSKSEHYLIEYFKKNKISFLCLYHVENHRINQLKKNPLFVEYYEEERNLRDTWRQEFEIVKEVWEKKDVAYVFHKSVGEFPYLSDNLDVLVKVNKFTEASKLLREIGYVNLRNIQEEHKEFYRRFVGDHVAVPIHLHERVCWVVPFENIEHIWKNIQQSKIDSMVFYPTEEDSILINVAHCFLEDHVIKLKDLFYVKKCIENKKIDWNYIFNTAKEMHWEISLHTAFIIMQHLHSGLFNTTLFPAEVTNISDKIVQKEKWAYKKIKYLIAKKIDMPFRIPHLWTRRHTAIRELSDPSFGSLTLRCYQVLGGLLDRFIHLKLKWHNQPAMLITFSGLDGSGKTRLISTLDNAFQNCEIITVKKWARVGSLPLSSLLSRIYKKVFRKGKNSISQTPYSGDSNRRSKVFIAWQFINIFELLTIYNISLRMHLFFNKVVLCDRYFYDWLVDLESFSEKPRYNRFLYSVLKKALPRSDTAFYVKVMPEVIKDRSVAGIEENIEENSLQFEVLINGQSIDIIDNSKEYSLVSSGLVRKVLEQYFNKYPIKYKNYKIVSYRYK